MRQKFLQMKLFYQKQMIPDNYLQKIIIFVCQIFATYHWPRKVKKKCKNNRIYGLHYRYLAGFQQLLPISLYIKMAPTAPTAMDRIATIMNWTMVPFLEPLFFSSLTLVIWNLTSSGELEFAATDEKIIVVVQNVYIY